MKCNVSKTGRVLRLLLGLLLIAWAIAGGPAWTWVGLLVLATGAWRLCPILMILGVRSTEPDATPARLDS